MTGTSLLDLTLAEVQRVLRADGLAVAHASTLWRACYHESILTTEARASVDPGAFPPPLRRWWETATGPGGKYHWTQPTLCGEQVSTDGLTRKYLLGLEDGREIETVIMGYPGRFTGCVSTQVGCAMGCVFCATGQGGFTRHLRPGEIVAQVWHLQRRLRATGAPGLRNLVLMGMGEPLHNYDSVRTALEIISDTGGLNIGPRRITISTVGVVPGILRLAEEPQPYNLAVSLHAATQEERARLVPVAARWPLDELMAACRDYCRRTGRRIFFEWTLIAGRNDSPAHAQQVAELLQGVPAHVNLIPLNPTAGYAGSATAQGSAAAFQAILRAAGLPSTLRQRRGIDVAAGCGQLAGATRRGSEAERTVSVEAEHGNRN